MHAECSTVCQAVSQTRQVDANVKNTACVRFSQTQKAELGREHALIDPIHLVIMLGSPHEGGCGLLNDSEEATFRHFCQCFCVTEHAPSGQPEDRTTLAGTRSRITRRVNGFSLTFSWKKQIKDLRQSDTSLFLSTYAQIQQKL